MEFVEVARMALAAVGDGEPFTIERT